MRSDASFLRRFWLVPLVVLALFAGCGGDDDPTVPTDTTAPAAITTLATGTVTAHTVVLIWTAVGDDGTTGTADLYDVRYSTATITAGNFASATTVSGEPTPGIAGTPQTMTVTGLGAATPYFFAMKTRDEASNWSDISNVVTATTAESGDETAPAAVTDLDGAAISTTSVLLTWTAPGDDGSTGTAAEYDIRYATTTISNANWGTATPATGEPAPEVAGTAQDLTVTGLTSDQDYFFALKTRDEAGNESALSNVGGPSRPRKPGRPARAPGARLPGHGLHLGRREVRLVREAGRAEPAVSGERVRGLGGRVLQAAAGRRVGAQWGLLELELRLPRLHRPLRGCQAGTEYTYTMTVDGSCSSDTYDNWVQFRAVSIAPRGPGPSMCTT